MPPDTGAVVVAVIAPYCTPPVAARAVIEEIRDYRYMNPDWNFLVVPRKDNPILADGNNLLDRRYLKHIKTY